MKKINIAELLKDCPKGMELDCTMIDNVVFEKLDFITSHHPIIIRRTDSNKTIHLTKYGQYSDEEDYKCVIFPKGKITWEGFVPPCKFKDGDIIYNRLQKKICIYYLCKDGVSRIKGCRYNESNIQLQFEKLEYPIPIAIQDYRLATEEEKQKLFQAIKDNGYKWNSETKTLEKLVNKNKFAIGDTITNGKLIGKIRSRDVDSYKLEDGTYIFFNEVPNWKLVPNKFDINTLVPFESKVLIRDHKSQKWNPAIWGTYDNDPYYPYRLIGTISHCCIPYEGNEHLLGTTNDCDDFYKIWE